MKLFTHIKQLLSTLFNKPEVEEEQLPPLEMSFPITVTYLQKSKVDVPKLSQSQVNYLIDLDEQTDV